jgi:hypothetical protein
MAHEREVPLFITPCALLLTEMARCRGLGETDTGGEVKLYEELMSIVVPFAAKS